MKKISVFKWLAIVTIFCAVVFSACKHDPDPQKKITVTGIPAAHNGRYAITGLGTSGGATVAISTPASINGGTANTELFDAAGDGFDVPFTGSGTYTVVLLIYDSTVTNVLWSGGLLGKSITDETTTIPYSEFIPLNSLAQQTQLRVRDYLSRTLKELTVK